MRLERITPGMLLLIVVAGCLVGSNLWIHTWECRWFVIIPLYAGMVLAIASLFCFPSDETRPAAEKFGALALLAYVGVEYFCEPFGVPSDPIAELFAEKETRVLIDTVVVPVIWLLPLVIGGLALPKFGWGLAGVAIWAVLFSNVTALSHNCWNGHRFLSNFGSFIIFD